MSWVTFFIVTISTDGGIEAGILLRMVDQPTKSELSKVTTETRGYPAQLKCTRFPLVGF